MKGVVLSCGRYRPDINSEEHFRDEQVVVSVKLSFSFEEKGMGLSGRGSCCL